MFARCPERPMFIDVSLSGGVVVECGGLENLPLIPKTVSLLLMNGLRRRCSLVVWPN